MGAEKLPAGDAAWWRHGSLNNFGDRKARTISGPSAMQHSPTSGSAELEPEYGRVTRDQGNRTPIAMRLERNLL